MKWVFFCGGAKPTFLQRALVERIGENEPVIAVEQAVSAVREPWRWPLAQRIRQMSNSVTEYRAFHTPEQVTGLRPILRALNRRRLVKELRTLLSEEPAIFCYDSPTQDHLVGAFGEKLSVYLAIDDRTVTVTGEPIPGELEAERRLLGMVDIVVCVSEYLAGVLRGRVPEGRSVSIHVVKNGYDERLFTPERDWPEPPALSAIPRPRVVVLGHVSERIDWEGIEGCRRLKPDWTWVFVGPADVGIPEKIHKLDFHYFPPVPVREVPGWIAHADACAVPYRLNPFTLASCPLKAYEYLAMGKPTLSTRVPALQELEGGLVWVEEGDGKSYAAALDRLKADCHQANVEALQTVRNRKCSVSHRVAEFKDLVMVEIRAQGSEKHIPMGRERTNA